MVRRSARTAGLLHAVADRRQLVGEVLPAGLGGVELRRERRREQRRQAAVHGKAVRWLEAATHVGLDHEAQATADDAVTVAPVNEQKQRQTTRCEQERTNTNASVQRKWSGGTDRRSDVCMRDTPSYGTRCLRRAAWKGSA